MLMWQHTPAHDSADQGILHQRNGAPTRGNSDDTELQSEAKIECCRMTVPTELWMEKGTGQSSGAHGQLCDYWEVEPRASIS